MSCESRACGVDSPLKREVYFLTMGCAKNEVDTRHMIEKVLAAGYGIASEIEQADAVIVNTCCFIQAATEESIDAVFECAGLPNVEAGAPLVVTGCMPARYGSDLQEALHEAKAFVPCSEEDSIVQVLDGLFGASLNAHETQNDQLAAGSCRFAAEFDTALNSQSDSSSFAYVKISDGCNRFCTFCAIPYIRGRYHSFSLESIHDEIEGLVSKGVREIVLIAQDTGCWGCDFPEPSSLAHLLDTLAADFPSTWFRVMYTEPEGISDELLQVLSQRSNVCSYLDIPLQHVVPSLLSDMHRKGSAEEFLDLLERVRLAVPDVALRTTLMVGFPGETEEDFQALCDFVEEACFDYVGVFAFSPEEGTKAFNLPGQLDEETKRERAQQLRDCADAVSYSVVSQRKGKRVDVLVEGREEDGQLFGRAMCQAPEVDGVTFLSSGDIGSIRSVEIEDTLLYEMEGE